MSLSALAALVARPVAASGDVVGRVPAVGDCYPHQWAYESSTSKYNALCASRQWGKTRSARRRARRMLGLRPGSRVIYATLIRRNCKKLFWHPVIDELRADGWDVDGNDSDLILTLPNGSWMQALSCSEMSDLKTIRGDQADLFIVDECQEPNDDVLEALVLKIATSMLMKRGGMLDLLGTVPEAEPCFFSQKLDDPKWRAFGHAFNPDGTERSPAASMFENLSIDPEEIRRTAEEAGLHPGHPIYEREVMGRRVKDPSKLAYEYDPARNVYDPEEVDFKGDQWRHSMGLDLGFQDRDAIVVVGWRRDDGDRHLYTRHTWQQNHLDVDQLAAVVAEVIRTYRPSIIVGDHGGHGAVKVLETLKNRMGILIRPKPPDVMVSVGLVNDDLRTGRLLLERGSELGTDLNRVQRTVNPQTKRVEINKRGYHSDLSEAMRYAHHGARHWAAKPPKPPESVDDRRRRQWEERERRMEDPWR